MEQVTDISSGILDAMAWAIGETIIIYFGIPLIVGLIIAFILRRVLGYKAGRIASKLIYYAVIIYVFLNGVDAFNYMIDSYETRAGIS
ncbi:hypothetical protein ABER98_19910 [Domibacillus aminovorans]|uniref:hypothetical protein n=1 Tax=Domibacillus aminovorans TaxID=29332 RepID=UPI003D2576EC